MDMLSVVSLIFLVAVLVIGFLKKVNMGFLAMGAALILGRIGGVADKTIIASFNTSLFISMVGPAFLFSMAVNNGSIDLLAKKLIKSTGKHSWLIPWVIAIVTYVLAAMGCGNVPTFAIILPLSIVIAMEMGIDPIAMGLIVTAGCNFGCMSPVSNGGIIITNLLAETEYAGQFSWEIFLNGGIAYLVCTAVIYVIYKMYKSNGTSLEMLRDLPKFDKNQIITLLACLAVVFAVFVFGVNIGLAAPLAAIVLVIFGVANDKAAIKTMPWGTYIMICGVSMLMAVVKAMGGVDLIVDGLTSIMTTKTTAPIISLAAGVMSWFSSTTGVVMPTLIPVVSELMETFPGMSYSGAVAGLTITSFFAAFSPASTGGAGILAQYEIFKKDSSGQNSGKLFMRLFLTSVVSVVVSVILVGLGVFTIF